MMLDGVRRRSATRRIAAGDGRTLSPFRWWQMPIRALFRLRLDGRDGSSVVYAVDVRHWANLDPGRTRAHLYVDGTQRAVSTLPARFPVAGGSVHVAMSTFGIRRCHVVAADGSERELEPDPRSAEGRRARLGREHPTLSRSIGILSIVLLVVGIGLNLLQVAEPISQIPAIADAVGTFVERAFRMRSHPLLDTAAS